MREKRGRFWNKAGKWFALIAGLAGFAYFLWQAIDYSAHLPTTVWDESMYLYKGFLFAQGKFKPFEDFGPWTNQLPFSFLLPGYVQQWFGPGMRTGRIYAVVVGALAVVGLWWTVKRSAGPWWAAGVVWVLALNPAYVQTFSQSFAQTLVSMLFAWMLFFGLGRDRSNWEMGLAAFLGGLAGMSRVNVLPAVFLFIIYVFWQYGRKSGLIALAAGLFPIVFFHALYWPEILKFWAYWIPESVFPWITDYRSPWREIFLPSDFAWFPVSDWINDRSHLAWVGVKSFWNAIRVNFVVILGAILSLIFYDRAAQKYRSKKLNPAFFFSDRKQFVYLQVSFWGLYLVHLWAANGMGCQFVCLPGYVMFFFMFGLALIPISGKNWNLEMGRWKQVLVVILVVGLLLVLEYNYNWDYLDFRYDVIRNTFDLTIPRMKDGKIVEGTGLVWELLQNKFGYDHFPLRQFILKNDAAIHLTRILKVLGLLILSAISYRIARKRGWTYASFGGFAAVFILLAGVGMSGTKLFGGHMTMDTCQDSVIASYEQVGEELDALIPAGAQVYYSVKADMLLLHLPDVEVYTPQLNAFFTYTEDLTADPETLHRFGWWNPVLKEEWIAEADYILIEQRFFDADWQSRLDAGQLEEALVTEPVASCRGDGARIMVLVPVE